MKYQGDVYYFVLIFYSFQQCDYLAWGKERVNLSAFRTFVRFAFILSVSLPHGVWERLRLVNVTLPGLKPP